MEIFTGIRIFDTVSFSLHANTTIGTTFKRVKIKGIVDFDTARTLIDPIALHENIIPNLPEGTLDNPRQYSYLKLLLSNGDTTYVGVPWIVASSVVKVTSGKLTIVLDDIDVTKVDDVLAALSANNFKVASSDFVG